MNPLRTLAAAFALAASHVDLRSQTLPYNYFQDTTPDGKPVGRAHRIAGWSSDGRPQASMWEDYKDAYGPPQQSRRIAGYSSDGTPYYSMWDHPTFQVGGFGSATFHYGSLTELFTGTFSSLFDGIGGILQGLFGGSQPKPKRYDSYVSLEGDCIGNPPPPYQSLDSIANPLQQDFADLSTDGFEQLCAAALPRHLSQRSEYRQIQAQHQERNGRRADAAARAAGDSGRSQRIAQLAQQAMGYLNQANANMNNDAAFDHYIGLAQGVINQMFAETGITPPWWPR